MRNKVKFLKFITHFAVLFLVILISGFFACKTVQTNGPSGHNINMGGVYHMSGLHTPENNCTQCHGNDLKGSGNAPSCYSCHGKKW